LGARSDGFAGVDGTALIAAIGGQLEADAHICSMLLIAGLAQSLNFSWSEQETPLHLTAASGSIDVVEMLLVAGADPNATGCLFCDALQAAATTGREEIVDLLLRKGAEPKKLQGPFGNANLAACIGSGQSHERIAETLKPLSHEPYGNGSTWGHAFLRVPRISIRGNQWSEFIIRMITMYIALGTGDTKLLSFLCDARCSPSVWHMMAMNAYQATSRASWFRNQVRRNLSYWADTNLGREIWAAHCLSGNIDYDRRSDPAI
jgi:ankyrin repeat protein